MRLAIIDLGTNTCNLLIAEVEGKKYKILYQGKEGVKLGKGGINKNMLTLEAFRRAAAALKKHLQIIGRFQITEVKTIATSAVRDAVNQNEFEAYLQEETGLKLTVISGEEEAAVIFKGVKMAFGQIPGKSLILDIGGGSNELIWSEHNEIVWKKSFPLGMARVIEQFHISDPLKPEEAEAIEAYFDHGLTALWNQLDGKTIDCLIGCSGAFDTLADLLDETPPGTKFRITQAIGIADFEQISCKVIRSTADQREKMTGMDPLRLEMIVPSFIFIRLIIKRLNINRISQTGFSLREGVLYEQINC
jgi:exopolyphosphatase/guanosine-5'-triphosphate,3'-diphosphate pyrophosphatase